MGVFTPHIADCNSNRAYFCKKCSLFPQKGNLRIGADADVVIVDMKREETVMADSLHSKQYRLFEGWTCKGRPVSFDILI